jgi:cell division protein FtsL|tara:strand:+ start:124 stop:324 length:201 start_codon:yes stop_codon:yes gene_type:complete
MNKNNRYIIIITFIITIISGFILFYLKNQEIDNLNIKIKKIEEENKKISKKLIDYKSVIDDISIDS